MSHAITLDGDVGARQTAALPTARSGHWIQALLLAALTTAPFLNKAFHIDDVLYLRVADQVLRSPLRPYDGMVLWDAPDGQPGKLFETDFNPPLWKYVLALTIKVAGREEWKLHLAEAVAIALAAVGIYRVSRRFGSRPLWCAVLIVAAPFFMPGTNLMLEGPMLCCCVWALEFQFVAWERNSARRSLLAGVLLAAGVLTKYTAGLLLPILFFAGLWRRPRHVVWIVLPTALGLGLWILHNRSTYGEAHFGAHGFVLGAHEVLVRFRSVVRCVGAVGPFGLLAVAVLWNEGRRGRVAGVCCAILAVVFAIAELAWLKNGISYGQGWSPTTLQTAHYAAFAAHGSFVLLAIFALAACDWLAGRRSVRVFDARTLLEVVLATYLAFNVFCVPFNAVRHLLLAFVAMVWLFADRLADARWPRIRMGTATISTALAFCLAAADYEIAGTYRRLAQQVVARWVQTGATVWYAGNWGFVHYANLAGGYPLVQHPAAYGFSNPKEGDLIVHPRLLTWRNLPLPSELAAVVALEHHAPQTDNPFRTIAPSVHYYSQVGETLPWEILVFAPDADENRAWFQLPPLDDVLVYRIERKSAEPNR